MLEPLHLFGISPPLSATGTHSCESPAKPSPILVLTLASLVFVLAVSGCLSLSAWPLDNDVTGIFRSTQECWKYTKEDLLQSMMTGVFANNPTSLENWHVHPAAM